MTADHECPAPGCSLRLPFEQLACRPHWFALPPELRRRLSRLWRTGELVGYVNARREAVDVLAALATTPR